MICHFNGKHLMAYNSHGRHRHCELAKYQLTDGDDIIIKVQFSPLS